MPAPPRAYDFPSLSPDGQRIAVEIGDGPRTSIWMPEIGSGSLTRVSPGDADSKPVWSSDARHLWYASRQKDERHIMWLPIDASAPPASLVSGRDRILRPGASSPDGRWLAYVAFEQGPPQVFVRPLAGGAPRLITPESGGQPRWARNGRGIFVDRLGELLRIPIPPRRASSSERRRRSSMMTSAS